MISINNFVNVTIKSRFHISTNLQISGDLRTIHITCDGKGLSRLGFLRLNVLTWNHQSCYQVIYFVTVLTTQRAIWMWAERSTSSLLCSKFLWGINLCVIQQKFLYCIALFYPRILSSIRESENKTLSIGIALLMSLSNIVWKTIVYIRNSLVFNNLISI